MGLVKKILNQYGNVKPNEKGNGKLYINDLPLYQALLDELVGKEVEYTLQEKQRNVTIAQYGYYHGVILPTALKDECFGGWEKDDLDAFLTKEFLGELKMKEIKGIPVEFRNVPSKSGISKTEMVEFINRVIKFLAEQGIVVPESSKQTQAYADNDKLVAKS